jgi:hypothetical protein
LATKREASSELATGLARSGESVMSRKVAGAVRTARRGAMIRPFGVRRSACLAAPTSRLATSFESIRSRKSSASGPVTST